jgi:hypothetical protein
MQSRAWKWSEAGLGLLPLGIACALWSVGCSSHRNTGSAGRTGSDTGGASASVGASGTIAAASGGGAMGGTGTRDSGAASGAMMTRDAGAKIDAAMNGTSGGSDSGSGTGVGGSRDSGTAGTTVSCLDAITDYEHAGPFKFEAKTAGSINFWVPMVPAGCKVPVIHLANGTGALCSSYQSSLERMATHGFLTICYESPNTAAGDQGIKAFEAAFAMFPELADHKLGSTGHDQGGMAAFTVLQLAEEKWSDTMVYAGLAMEPESGSGPSPTNGTWQEVYAKIKSPMFMFSALGTDGLVSQAWVQQSYDATSPTEEAYFWTANGAKHIPVPNGEEQEISIPWFRWKLLNDQKACAFFKAIPTTNPKWAEVASKNTQPCR